MSRKTIKMVEMVLARNATIVTTYGHAIEFVKNEPVFVPQIVVPELSAVGAVPVDGPSEDADISESRIEEVDPGERAKAIKTAIEAMVARNIREEFTASGAPNANVVSKEAGFKVQTKEIIPVWDEIRSQGEE